MRVLIGGASGLIGTALRASLRADGHEIVRLVRRPVSADDELQWDPQEHRIPRDAVEGIDAVVNLNGVGIGERRWTERQKEKILVSRITATGTLAGAMAQAERPPRVFVSSSGVDYYGSSGDEVLTEEAPAGDGFLASVCRGWEQATSPAAEAGIRTVVLRSGVVLTPEGGPLKRQLLPFKLGLGGPVGDGEQWLSWIALDDAVSVIRFAIDTPQLDGPVNSTSPNPVRQREFAQTLGEALHRPAKLPTPVFALKAVFGSELVQTLLVEGQRVVPEALQAAGFVFSYPTLESALQEMVGG